MLFRRHEQRRAGVALAPAAPTAAQAPATAVAACRDGVRGRSAAVQGDPALAAVTSVRLRIGPEFPPGRQAAILAALSEAGITAVQVEALPFEIATSRVGYYRAEDLAAAEALGRLVSPVSARTARSGCATMASSWPIPSRDVSTSGSGGDPRCRADVRRPCWRGSTPRSSPPSSSRQPPRRLSRRRPGRTRSTLRSCRPRSPSWRPSGRRWRWPRTRHPSRSLRRRPNSAGLRRRPRGCGRKPRRRAWRRRPPTRRGRSSRRWRRGSRRRRPSVGRPKRRWRRSTRGKRS